MTSRPPYIRHPETGRRMWIRRWRCHLCRPLRWRNGTPADALSHYQLLHQDQDGTQTWVSGT